MYLGNNVFELNKICQKKETMLGNEKCSVIKFWYYYYYRFISFMHDEMP